MHVRVGKIELLSFHSAGFTMIYLKFHYFSILQGKEWLTCFFLT